MQTFERFILWLLAVAALIWGVVVGVPTAVKAFVGQHDRAVITDAHDKAQGVALTAGTADAGQASAACSRAISRARAAGYASAQADAAPPPVDGTRRTYTGADFMNQIGGAP